MPRKPAPTLENPHADDGDVAVLNRPEPSAPPQRSAAPSPPGRSAGDDLLAARANMRCELDDQLIRSHLGIVDVDLGRIQQLASVFNLSPEELERESNRARSIACLIREAGAEAERTELAGQVVAAETELQRLTAERDEVLAKLMPAIAAAEARTAELRGRNAVVAAAVQSMRNHADRNLRERNQAMIQTFKRGVGKAYAEFESRLRTIELIVALEGEKIGNYCDHHLIEARIDPNKAARLCGVRPAVWHAHLATLRAEADQIRVRMAELQPAVDQYRRDLEAGRDCHLRFAEEFAAPRGAGGHDA